jgi:glycosyltransferase involved in cell wall biosynthesis
MRRRIAFIDYFPTHYRRRLYEELARRTEADFYFFADERERYWNRKIPLANEGDYRRVELRRFRPFDEAVMPGIVPRLRPSRYDAVIKNLNGKLMLPLTYGAAKASGLPFVLWTGMWMHPTTRVHRFTHGMTAGIYRGADAIVTYGDHVRDFVLATDGVSPEKVFVAGQAVEKERFVDVRRSTNGHANVLFIGQFEERKGLFDLIDAFGMVDRPEARLRLVGNGSLEGEVRRHAERDRRIEIVGYVPQDDLPAQLASARCLVLPSVTTAEDKEPWGLVVNEAMHAGVPVVATDAVGAAAGGLVQHGKNGYVVPERDAPALAGALRSLVEDHKLARRLGERARGDADEFNYERMADAFVSAVDYAIDRRGA